MTIVTDCTEASVQARIMYEKRSSSLALMPNYTPLHWWENDLFQITNAGLWVEYEIKRSLNDYRADFRKTDSCQGRKKFKHDILAAGSDKIIYDPYEHIPTLVGKHLVTVRVPNRFYFCVPIELDKKITPPEYAGLIIYNKANKKTSYIVSKPAPLIHKVKHGEAILRPALVAAYNRYRWKFIESEIKIN